MLTTLLPEDRASTAEISVLSLNSLQVQIRFLSHLRLGLYAICGNDNSLAISSDMEYSVQML